MAFNWVCPWCDRPQAVVADNFQHSAEYIKFHSGADGRIGLGVLAYLCANPECQRTTIEIYLKPFVMVSYNPTIDVAAPDIFRERVLPRGASRPQPDFIPQAIRADYYEACLIRDLSPKAAATLARRCLQGMIRDFCEISRPRLIDEINALRAAVDDGSAPRAVTIESVNAIDHVRSIGNIGAHMERDIDVIVEVDAGEAQALIELIELLMREWYVESNTRKQRLASITAIGEGKASAKIQARAQAALPAPEDGVEAK